MISIVTAYYNRKNLFYHTLKSITKSEYKNIEVIAVDDGSSLNERIEDLQNEFSFLKIIRLEKENKWYNNPCIPFNVGFKEAKGDIILIQNPECLHVHDVLSHINNNLNDTKYITISAYGINKEMNKKIPGLIDNEQLPEYFKTFPQQPYVGYESIGWYNHTIYRPVAYHFCSAITRKNMAELNGFDERYGKGIGYDDNEILVRISRLGLRITIEDNVSVIHQYHDTVSWNRPDTDVLTERNKRLLYEVTMKEQKYRANFFNLWNGI